MQVIKRGPRGLRAVEPSKAPALELPAHVDLYAQVYLDQPTAQVRVPGQPRGKQRPRMTRQGHAYTPHQTVVAEAWVRSCTVDQVGQLALDCPLAVDLTVVVPVPRSWSKKRQEAARTGDTKPTGKPDLDNIAKLHLDALNGILWLDDAQVVDLRVRKVYGEAPGVVIRLWKV